MNIKLDSITIGNGTITLVEASGETGESYSIQLLEQNGVKIVREGNVVAFAYEPPDMQEDLQSMYHALTRKYGLSKAWSAEFIEKVEDAIKEARFDKALDASEVPNSKTH